MQVQGALSEGDILLLCADSVLSTGNRNLSTAADLHEEWVLIEVATLAFEIGMV